MTDLRSALIGSMHTADESDDLEPTPMWDFLQQGNEVTALECRLLLPFLPLLSSPSHDCPPHGRLSSDHVLTFYCCSINGHSHNQGVQEALVRNELRNVGSIDPEVHAYLSLRAAAVVWQKEDDHGVAMITR